MVNIMLSFAGADQRQDDLFGNENFFSKGKSALKGLKVRRVAHCSARAPDLGHSELIRIVGARDRAWRTSTRSTRRICPRRSTFSCVAGSRNRATRT